MKPVLEIRVTQVASGTADPSPQTLASIMIDRGSDRFIRVVTVPGRSLSVQVIGKFILVLRKLNAAAINTEKLIQVSLRLAG